MADMTGQAALVTGGIRGIGLAICERLMNRGVKVAAGVLLEPGDRPTVRRKVRRSRGEYPPGQHRFQRGLRTGHRRGA